MKNFKNLINAIVLAVLLMGVASQDAHAQISLSTGTISANVLTQPSTGNVPPTRITVNSTSTMQSQGTQNQYNTILYLDKELMCVVTVVSSTQLDVKRGCGIGAAGIVASHVSGAAFYYANTTGPSTLGGPVTAASQFSNAQGNSELYGYCLRSAVTALPVIYTFNGDVFDCKRTGAAGTAGQWIKVGNGSMAAAGSRLNFNCTGTVGSAETDFLNDAACSGATTATIRQVIGNYGTVANFRAFSSAAFLGTGGSTFTVLKNGSNTNMVCAPTATATTCNDLTHSFQVAPGDVITVKFLSATSDTAANLSVSLGLY